MTVTLQRKHRPAALCFSQCHCPLKHEAVLCLWASENATSRAGHTHAHTLSCTHPSTSCYGNRALKKGQRVLKDAKKVLWMVLTQGENGCEKCWHFFFWCHQQVMNKFIWFIFKGPPFALRHLTMCICFFSFLVHWGSFGMQHRSLAHFVQAAYNTFDSTKDIKIDV